jgi:hypothetical protein
MKDMMKKIKLNENKVTNGNKIDRKINVEIVVTPKPEHGSRGGVAVVANSHAAPKATAKAKKQV